MTGETVIFNEGAPPVKRVQVKPALLIAAALGFALFGAAGTPRLATAYDGLMSGGGSSSSSSGGGYDGLLAPSQPNNTGGSRAPTQEPPGYEGLMRGSVPQRPAEPAELDDSSAPATAATPATRQPAGRQPAGRPAQTAKPELAMTPRPGRVRVGPTNSAEQLMMLAALNGRRLDMEQIARAKKPSLEMIGLKDPQQIRINGMLPMELMAKNQVERVLASVNNPNIPEEMRRTNARNGYSSLMALADGIMSRRAIPTEAFRNYGFSDTFLAEEKEANERALARFEEAFKVLRPLQ